MPRRLLGRIGRRGLVPPEPAPSQTGNSSADGAPPAAAPTPPEQATLIGNERAKLTATYVNGLAIAIFAVGALTLPMNSVLQGSPPPYIVGVVLVCVVVSMTLHSIARLILGGLR